MVTSRKMTNFLRSLIQENDPFLLEMQRIAREERIPIIPPESANFLEILIRISGIQKILEIGTSIGYSAIVFSKAMGPGGKVYTIEIDENTIEKARENFAKAGVLDQIIVFQGDVMEILPYMQGKYDMIFMDGPKGHYEECLDYFLPLLRDGGILVYDNVLFRGMVSGDRKLKRRKITIVKRMRSFLKVLSTHPQLHTTILPIGDGLSVSIKRKEFAHETT
ncbi:MAG: O-methyltransferase [Clostridia bacterium]|jgi:predicted O-methyltransferase YrrM